MAAPRFASKLDFFRYLEENGVIDQMVRALLQVYETEAGIDSPTELVAAAFEVMVEAELRTQIATLRAQLRSAHRHRRELVSTITGLLNELNRVSHHR